MTYGWIDASVFSFNTLLLMDAWMIRHISHREDAPFNQKLATALAANPAVNWFFGTRCPQRRDYFESLAQSAPRDVTPKYVRECEIYVLDALDSFIVYLYPELMERLPYIRDWDADRLLSITNFKGKAVLDIGSGTGRLAIAAAPYAAWVYAVEPAERLREYLREKLERLHIENVYTGDGTLERLPFPDETFDIVVSGHVLGDDPPQELGWMSRVTKNGGCIIDCPGEDDRKRPEGPNPAMLALGFKMAHYVSKSGGDVYRYWKWK